MAVIVTNAQQVLFGRRRLAVGGFEWQLPGGWIEIGESPQQAAQREVLEETGLSLSNLRFIGITSNVFSARKHSISLYFEAECIDRGALIATENEKCHGWQWRRWAEINDRLFLPLHLLKQTGYHPFSTPEKSGCVSN